MRDFTTCNVDELTFQDIVDFCRLQKPENLRLEYKAEFSQKDPAFQIAKEVSAFANTQGGIVILGVPEGGERRGIPVVNPPGRSLGPDPRNRVLESCIRHVFPPLYAEVSPFLENPEQSGIGFMVIRIPPSEDVPHTMESRTGIYIRNMDRSDHFDRATDEQIRLLLNRRAVAQNLQRDRLNRARGTMLAAAGEKANAGTMVITIGPSLATESLLSLPALMSEAPKFSISSGSGDRWPIDSTRYLRGALDSIYSFHKNRSHGATIDIYGNFVTLTHVNIPRKVERWGVGEEDMQYAVEDDRGFIKSINVMELAAYLNGSFLVASNFYRQYGVIGRLSLLVELKGVRGALLVSPQQHFGDHPISICRLHNDIEIAEELWTSELGADSQKMLRPTFQRLLWALDCTDENRLDGYWDLGECFLFGHQTCSCGKWYKPKNQAKCLPCRQVEADVA